jgi:hypothetical protein
MAAFTDASPLSHRTNCEQAVNTAVAAWRTGPARRNLHHMGGTGGAVASIAGLDVRLRQVLRFTATYCHERGHLPAASDVAQGCGIGSTSTVVKALRQLEQLGLLERDPHYPRLGRVTADLPTCQPAVELAVLELAVHESRGNLDIVREALRWAPDTEAVAFLHREGLARATLLRAYEDARARLRNQGVVLSAAVQAIVDRQPDVIRARQALVDGWESYCVYSAAMTALARMCTSSIEAIGLSLLEPVFVSEAIVYDLDSRLDKVVAAQCAAADGPGVERIVRRIASDVTATFGGLARTFPELPVPPVHCSSGMLGAPAG